MLTRNRSHHLFDIFVFLQVSINQCDRILLAGGKVHTGRVGIYRPNVTIMTNPASSSRWDRIGCLELQG